MIHIGGLAVKTELFILICSLFVMLIQLLLCFKVKNLYLRLIPAVPCFASAATLSVMAVSSEGWDGFGYMVLAIFCGCFLLAAGIGWAIWAVAGKIKNAKKHK